MSDLFEYIEDNKDFSFKEKEFNEVDNAILSRLSYIDFPNYIGKSLEEIVKIFEFDDFEDAKIFSKTGKMTEELLKAVSQTKRYKDVIIDDYNEIASVNLATAFCAVVFKITNDTSYIAFRGTDDKIMSFYEDAELAYSFPIPSQISAFSFVRTKITTNNTKYYLGGHSKGGNLALFAYVFLRDDLKEHIIKVYNNDGPGFPDELAKILFKPNLSKKIVNIVPECSIVGRILEANAQYEIIKSSATGPGEHNIFTWEVNGTQFEKAEKFNLFSEIVGDTLDDCLETISPDDMKNAAQTIYKIAIENGIESTDDINVSNFKSILNTLIDILESEKNGTSDISLVIKEMIKNLFNAIDIDKIIDYFKEGALKNLKEVTLDDFVELLNIKDVKDVEDLKEKLDIKDLDEIVESFNIEGVNNSDDLKKWIKDKSNEASDSIKESFDDIKEKFDVSFDEFKDKIDIKIDDIKEKFDIDFDKSKETDENEEELSLYNKLKEYFNSKDYNEIKSIKDYSDFDNVKNFFKTTKLKTVLDKNKSDENLDKKE